MKKTIIYSSKQILITCILLLGTLNPLVYAENITRIAVVDSSRILHESSLAKIAQLKLEKEFSKQVKNLQDLDQRLHSLSNTLDKTSQNSKEYSRLQNESTKLNNEFQHKQHDLQINFNKRRNEEFTTIIEHANHIIKVIAEQNNYDVVIQEAVYANPRIDITNQVIKVLNE